MGPTSTLPSIDKDTLPENSLAAMKRALDLGADGLEFDVHITKDNQVAVIHDNELNKKIAGADRKAKDLGLVSQHTMAELSAMNVGNGQGIPSLSDVMDLMIAANADYNARTGKSLMIDIELKGEGVAEATYRTIKPYIDAGYVKSEDFVFNSFNWDNLRELRALDADLKLIPAIRTEDLFGKDNVTMPGWQVKPGADYQFDAFARLKSLHNEINCHAFDCIVFDLRPQFVNFCKSNKIGLFTSTSAETVKADRIREPLALMTAASHLLPVVCFRADHAGDTRALVTDICREQAYIAEMKKPYDGYQQPPAVDQPQPQVATPPVRLTKFGLG